jgi:hypothetical protein
MHPPSKTDKSQLYSAIFQLGVLLYSGLFVATHHEIVASLLGGGRGKSPAYIATSLGPHINWVLTVSARVSVEGKPLCEGHAEYAYIYQIGIALALHPTVVSEYHS